MQRCRKKKRNKLRRNVKMSRKRINKKIKLINYERGRKKENKKNG
jgi:hypothetical protein